MYARRFSTTCGVASAASKFCRPPMPTRFIHSRSSWIPSLVTLPFIQCHHTRGRALLGGFSNPRLRGSLCGVAGNDNPRTKNPRHVCTLHFIICPLFLLVRLSGNPIFSVVEGSMPARTQFAIVHRHRPLRSPRLSTGKGRMAIIGEITESF